MAIRFYNTLTRRKEVFEPLEPKKVRMYNCGPTVYNFVHIGNCRAFMLADLLRRYLEYRGYEVMQVMNITDVGHLVSDADEGEDKMELAAKQQKRDIWELTGKMAYLGRRVRSIVARIDQGLKSIIVPGLLFEKLGFRYIGPVDGHNLSRLIRVLTEVRKFRGPILVHVLTKKGKGYKFAEEDAPRFHGLGPFDVATGKSKKKSAAPTYSQVFGEALVEIASKNPKVVGITAAMSLGTGLVQLADAFPDRFYDVGIAEGHAVTFAAGLATRFPEYT